MTCYVSSQNIDRKGAFLLRLLYNLHTNLRFSILHYMNSPYLDNYSKTAIRDIDYLSLTGITQTRPENFIVVQLT